MSLISTWIICVILVQFNLSKANNLLETKRLDLELYTNKHELTRSDDDSEPILHTDTTLDYDNSYENNEKPATRKTEETDMWSVTWYVASFAGLISFFVVVSCSEWCCRRNARNTCARNALRANQINDAPPPSYDQFAPPSYDSLCDEKREFEVYVVPVHTFGTLVNQQPQKSVVEDAPPSYLTANLQGAIC